MNEMKCPMHAPKLAFVQIYYGLNGLRGSDGDQYFLRASAFGLNWLIIHELGVGNLFDVRLIKTDHKRLDQY